MGNSQFVVFHYALVQVIKVVCRSLGITLLTP
ncbi:DUF3265 domain-containing protein [Aeromonas jandaei]|nr:DUF3265 domain-containing protein [Aeromonas jandaei]